MHLQLTHGEDIKMLYIIYKIMMLHFQGIIIEQFSFVDFAISAFSYESIICRAGQWEYSLLFIGRMHSSLEINAFCSFVRLCTFSEFSFYWLIPKHNIIFCKIFFIFCVIYMYMLHTLSLQICRLKLHALLN